MAKVNKTLLELVTAGQNMTRSIIENGGELTPDLEKALSMVEIEVPAKIDQYVEVLDRLDMEEVYWKSKAKERTAIAKGCANASKRLRDTLRSTMKVFDFKEIFGNDYRFLLTTSAAKLVVENESLIPQEFKMQVTEWVLDKEKIKSALKDKIEIPGVSLEQKGTLRKYVNKENQ